jgi:hypothetical protein
MDAHAINLSEVSQLHQRVCTSNISVPEVTNGERSSLCTAVLTVTAVNVLTVFLIGRYNHNDLSLAEPQYQSACVNSTNLGVSCLMYRLLFRDPSTRSKTYLTVDNIVHKD